jgi:putative phage-type endonuclease
MAQRTPEWHQARLGLLTGSRAADMLATIQKGEAAARRDLRVQLLVERLTGQASESGYVSPEMQWGTDHEAEALAAYESHTGQIVAPVGFVQHDTLQAGCSPDGWTLDRVGLVSIKCPKSATHLRYLKSNGMPSEHRAQTLHELWITGCQWCDFVSYDPRFPEHLRLLVVRVSRDESAIAEYTDKAKAFLTELSTEESSLKGWSAAVPA